MIRLRALVAFSTALILAAGGPLAAQQQPAPPPSTAPAPAQTSPLPTTTAPNPVADPTKSAAPAPQQAIAPPPAGQAAVGTPGRPTLIEKPGEPGDVDEVTLPAKPAAIVSGKTKWEEAIVNLTQAFTRIEADLAKLGIAPAGRPLAVFTRTDDDGFEFEAMIPVAAAPNPAPTETDGLRFGTTPSGKALRFPHRGSYESIDSTYETLTAYLDAKDIVVQDRFVEEYATDLKDGTDDNLDVNIFALVK
ncbi:transcriptional regulator [Methylobacterium sp. GXS13]|uniref:GyrI-like domain-containing protein n=1 Tax=unclassified Methylobacterium TaxID=2615210 RepID=UPI00071B4D11|nr:MULTISPECIES: GyrI-like domain-containing protein [unclassified Methylobacterium]KST57787.1 transcriptional regulator [Methylobacterium sp. GXS13]MCJ2115878.1 GyrI-like domain-containing protein [Methylobacterium sp. J-001]